MKRKHGKRIHKFEDEIAIARGIDAVCGDAFEPEFIRHGFAIKGERCARHRS